MTHALRATLGKSNPIPFPWKTASLGDWGLGTRLQSEAVPPESRAEAPATRRDSDTDPTLFWCVAQSPVVEDLIERDDLARGQLEEPGLLLVGNEGGRVLIFPGSLDGNDVAFARRGP